MKKVLKTIGLSGLSGALLKVAVYCEQNNKSVGAMLGSTVVGIVIPYLFQSIADLTDNTNWKATQRKLKRAGILQKDTMVRISFAYLFRIKVDGKYFLVQSARTKKYQPAGGAYKFEKEEAIYFSEHLPVENDDRIPVDETTESDYRLLVKNKDLRKFVRRFNTTKYRENVSDLRREFVEEIFTAGILNKQSFGELSYKYCGRHMTDLAYGKVFKHYELLFADIIEVRLTDSQKQLFRKLMGTNCSKYIFATADEIDSLGVKYKSNEMADNIANHSFKILSENNDNLKMRNKYKKEITLKIL